MTCLCAADALFDAGQRAGQDQDEPRHRHHLDGHRPPPRRLLHRAGQIRFVTYMIIQNVMIFRYHYILYIQYVMIDEWGSRLLHRAGQIRFAV